MTRSTVPLESRIRIWPERKLARFCAQLRAEGLVVATGEFGAEMKVELVNDGPVTIVLSSDELRGPRREP